MRFLKLVEKLKTGLIKASPQNKHVAMKTINLLLAAATVAGYLSPKNLLDVANTSTVMSGSLDGTWATMDSFIFSLGGDEAGTIGEIRIGTTLGSVTPVPEPGHLAVVLGLASLAYIVTKRRLSRK